MLKPLFIFADAAAAGLVFIASSPALNAVASIVIILFIWVFPLPRVRSDLLKGWCQIKP